MDPVDQSKEPTTPKRLFSVPAWIAWIAALLVCWVVAISVGLGAAWNEADSGRSSAGAYALMYVLLVLPFVVVLGRVGYVIRWNVHHHARAVSFRTESAFLGGLAALAVLVLAPRTLDSQFDGLVFLAAIAVGIVVDRWWLRRSVDPGVRRRPRT